ncbi:MAG: aldo/keto reductase [Mariniblastus sp.]|nr:aldo/keto reductase [Mariniblastus sp.]
MPDLVLGTVQFGLDYGVTNDRGCVPVEEVESILSFAHQRGVTRLDTAQNYGDAERVIGEVTRGSVCFQVSSKLPGCGPLPLSDHSMEEWDLSLQRSLDRMRLQSVDCLMVHSAEDLLRPDRDILLQWLHRVKDQGLIHRIGASLYYGAHVERLPLSDLDLVQLPISAYDRRFVEDGTLRFLKGMNLNIQARSLFLQGLILAAPGEWPDWVSAGDLDRHREFWLALQDTGWTPLEYAYQYTRQLQEVDSVVVGVTRLAELESIVRVHDSEPPLGDSLCPPSFSDHLLDPRTWVAK